MTVFTGGEAADVVLQDFDHYWNALRKKASSYAGDDPRRILVVEALELFGLLEDAVLYRLGQPSRKGPPRPELAGDR